MIRRLNYTGRVKIRRSDVQLSMGESGGVPSFNALINLDSYGFEGDALVFVEAYRQTIWMRFPFGTAAKQISPADRRLTEFDCPEGIHFRVKVTKAHDTHTLLGEADGISMGNAPREPMGHDSLISTKPENLGDELWRVDFTNEPPLLLVTNQIGDWRKLVQSPMFSAFVYPAVLREVLTRVLVQENHRDTDDAEDWKSRWLRFAVALPGVGDLPPKDDDSRADDWIQNVVTAFSHRLGLLEKFRAVWEEIP